MTSPRSTAFVTLLLGGLVFLPARAFATPQVVVRATSPDGTARLEALLPGQGLVRLTLDDTLVHQQAVDPEAPLRVLVEFDALPTVSARRAGAGGAQPAQRLEQLRADLAGLGPGAATTADRSVPVARITHGYSQVFSGAALTVSPRLLDRLRALPYIRRIVADDSVHAMLDQSVPLIRADKVRNELGATGSGIRVGIIDTGIDYRHAAFGGAFGPGTRVAGGYDFVNDDADPLDDNGHGTHVAGIVAGNGGGVTGVAPGATLYAFKVLNADGVGYESEILAALDRVLDPDGDPGTADALSIVNLSLGTWAGSPDDPMALALDRLTDAGVVCCAAAGNLGGYFTIGSPGTSRRAITVGASDRVDAVAWFSSRGPVAGTLDLKPDLVAPGVDIASAAPGGGTARLSGTSMATPHVAGVAALLLQLHPAWTPGQVKSALVGRAVGLNYSPFLQGSGRLDAYAAATASIAIAPTHLSFGRVPTGAPTFSRAETLHVENLTPQPRLVTFPASYAPGSGVTLSVTPTSVPLSGGARADVVVRLDFVDASSPTPLDPPFGFAGTLLATSGEETYRVPFTLHQAASLTVESPQPIHALLVEDHATRQVRWLDFVPPTPILLPVGRYDVLASFYPFYRFVLRSDVVVSGDDRITIDPAEATIRYGFEGSGPGGAALDWNAGGLALSRDGSPWSIGFAGFPVDSILVSPAPAAYRLEWTRVATNYHDRWVTVPGAQAGFSSSRTFDTSGADFRHVAMRFPATAAPSVAPLVYDWIPDHLSGGYFGLGFFDPAQSAITGPFTFDFWFAAPPYEGHLQLGNSVELYPWTSGTLDLSQPPQVLSPQLRLDRGWPAECHNATLLTPVWAPVGATDMGLFEGLPVWRGQFRNTRLVLTVDGGPDYIAPHVFTDMYGAVRTEPEPAYTLTRGGVTVLADTLRGAGGFSTWGPIPITLPGAGAHDFHVARAYTVGGRAARLDVLTHMDTTLPDPDPPLLRSLQLFANGGATDSIAFADRLDAGLRFRVRDDAEATPTVSVREGRTGAWVPLASTLTGDEYMTRFPATLRGEIALRLAVVDPSGNRLEMTWDPAFIALLGSAIPWPPPGAETVLALRGARPNPTSATNLTVEFALASAAAARLELFDTAGRRVASQDVGALGAGPHAVIVAPGARLRPGIYFIRLSQDGAVVSSRVCVLD